GSKARQEVQSSRSEVIASHISPGTRILKADVSSLPGDDLMLIDSSNRRLTVVAANSKSRSYSRTQTAADSEADLTLASLEVEGEPLGALPMRLDGDGLNDLVLFRAGNSRPTVILSSQIQAASEQISPASDLLSPQVTFSNSASIAINDTLSPPTPATPYPSTINVSGVSGTTSKVTVTLTGLSHTFPDDIDILLVGPSGQKMILMSDAGGGNSCSNVTLTFDDAAPGSLPDEGLISTGTYKPTDGPFTTGTETFPAPAPGPSYASALSVFNGTSPNGLWSLYVVDDEGFLLGNISGGWSLTISTGTSLVVTKTSDDGSVGTLRWAISQANAISGADTITFNIPGAGTRTINLTSELPVITETVTVDGSSQPGFSGIPLIELDGAGAGAGAHGLFVTAPNCRIRGFAINNFGTDGIAIANQNGNIIEGNYIGTNATGVSAKPNLGWGISIFNASGNLIGGTTASARNIISGNALDGVLIFPSSAGTNMVQGNFIGTNASGSAPLGNARLGIFITAGPN
ncbi:MAG: right-handed parallel beta-helix repeat-containing protein, partial [Blastocatellia bacterium]